MFRHFKNFVALVKRQYDKNVQVFRYDQESGLGNLLNEWVDELGLQVEWSAVKISDQNGQSERSGGGNPEKKPDV